MVTLAYIPDEYVQQILNIDANGQMDKTDQKYFNERINGDVGLWAKLKISNFKLYSTPLRDA